MHRLLRADSSGAERTMPVKELIAELQRLVAEMPEEVRGEAFIQLESTEWPAGRGHAVLSVSRPETRMEKRRREVMEAQEDAASDRSMQEYLQRAGFVPVRSVPSP
jgi:hypothetical protein